MQLLEMLRNIFHFLNKDNHDKALAIFDDVYDLYALKKKVDMMFFKFLPAMSDKNS